MDLSEGLEDLLFDDHRQLVLSLVYISSFKLFSTSLLKCCDLLMLECVCCLNSLVVVVMVVTGN